jgi:DHA2 family metal-tetracycline-proton antiporter-like MFS transporter
MNVILLVAIGVFLANLDGSIVNIAIPTLLHYFTVGPSTASLVVISYLLAMSSFLLLFGKLSDIHGSRKIFIGGFTVFLFSSILCTFSSNIYLLSFFRFIQGIGGAMLSATFGSLVAQYVPREMMGRAFGFMSVAGGAGFAFGAPAGGLILMYFNWKWIFYINIPICLIAIFMAKKILPEKKSEPAVADSENLPLAASPAYDKEPAGKEATPKVKIDAASVLLSFAGLCSLNIALNVVEAKAWQTHLIIVSALCLLVFIFRQTKVSFPLLDMSIFADRHFCGALASTFLAGATLAGTNFLFPFYFEYVLKFSAAKTGMFLMIIPFISTFLGPVAGYLADRFGARIVSVAGSFLMSISLVMIYFFAADTSVYYISLSFAVFGVSLAFFLTANICIIMGRAPEGKQGMVSSVSALNMVLSATLGVSIFASLFTFFSTASLSDPASTINAFHKCFFYFIILGIMVFITTIFTKGRTVKNEQ